MATHTHTHSQYCNTFCFSTATVVAKTHLNVTFIRTLPRFFLPVSYLKTGPIFSVDLKYFTLQILIKQGKF